MPGLGLVTTVVAVLLVGVVATNVIGRRLLQRVEHWLMLVPLFRTVYAPVRQLVLAFSPDNEYGFKQVVLVADPHRGYVMGFLTREFSVVSGGTTQSLVAVYVPTNHRVPRRRAHLRPGQRDVPGPVGRGGHPHLPDGRHGPARPGPGQRSDEAGGPANAGRTSLSYNRAFVIDPAGARWASTGPAGPAFPARALATDGEDGPT